MVHLYHKDVQKRCVELGLTTEKNIRRRALLMKLCTVVYLAVLLPCVLVVNKARGFFEMCWQMTVILLIVNLIRPFAYRRIWGWAHKGMDYPRNGGHDAVHKLPRQSVQVGRRNRMLIGSGGDFRRNNDTLRVLKIRKRSNNGYAV